MISTQSSWTYTRQYITRESTRGNTTNYVTHNKVTKVIYIIPIKLIKCEFTPEPAITVNNEVKNDVTHFNNPYETMHAHAHYRDEAKQVKITEICTRQWVCNRLEILVCIIKVLIEIRNLSKACSHCSVTQSRAMG